MSESLADLLSKDSLRNDDLRRLMHICRSGAQFVSIVCIGAGDAFISRYWPSLQLAVNREQIKLTVADKKPLDKLAPPLPDSDVDAGLHGRVERIRKLYREFQACVDRQTVKYVNLEHAPEKAWYDHMRADVVLVLVPDYNHIEAALKWLKRSTLIVVEKPFSDNLDDVEAFEKQMDDMVKRLGQDIPVTWVVPFDHYLAKIDEYATRKEHDNLPRRIGPIESVSFQILEPTRVEPWRSESLRGGLVSDLFTHVLAMLSVEFNVAELAYDSIAELKVSSHFKRDDDYKKETFAHLEFIVRDFHDRDVRVSGRIGKGVGSVEQKELIFRGRKACLRFDLCPGAKRHICLGNAQGENYEPHYNVGGGHIDFLEALLNGTFGKRPVGGLTSDAAKAMIRMLNGIHNRIDQRLKQFTDDDAYNVGASLDEILEKALRVI